MERNIHELKEQVVQLERRIEIAKKRVERARWLSEMLVRAKAQHPRFPYWEWQFHNISSSTVRVNLDRVLDCLSSRFYGTWEFGENCKDVPGVPSDQLYQPHPPTIEEVYSFIKIAGRLSSNAQVTEMFVRMRTNGYQNKWIDFVLGA